MNDYPYSVLMKDERAYEIMQLRDQYDNTFTDLAKEYGLSAARVVQLYNRIKLKQVRLYIHHIAVVSGCENTLQMRDVYNAAFECYRDMAYVCAYLEKEYAGILTPYRAGEPGMPKRFLDTIPPFRKTLSKKAIDRVIEMREAEKASYRRIAEELHITAVY